MTDQSSVAQELEALKKALQGFPEGALIENLITRTNLGFSRRTLQRRLLKLQQAGVLRVEGKTRAAKYYIINQQYAKSISSDNKARVPLSQGGQEILEQINHPFQDRTPVRYNRAFLEAYQPNRSAYLTFQETEKLEKIGKTAMPEKPAGTYAKEILSRLLIDLSWNSSRLEGNTYSLLDTQRLIAFGEVAADKSATEAQMILNHKDAITFLVQASEDIRFNRYTILNLHALLANNLLPDPSAVGRLRTFSVGIAHSVYEPLTIPQVISEIFDLILEKTEQINNPFEQAFFIMVHLLYLQPFDDVNKRVSRLAANIPFFRHNLAPLSFIDVPNQSYIQGMIGIYELNRIDLLKDVFIWAYQRSSTKYAALCQSLGEANPFMLKYSDDIRLLIFNIITQVLAPKIASAQIIAKAKSLPKQDQEKFIEAVETELLSLHEGNFARYQISPRQFDTWKKAWRRQA